MLIAAPTAKCLAPLYASLLDAIVQCVCPFNWRLLTLQLWKVIQFACARTSKLALQQAVGSSILSSLMLNVDHFLACQQKGDATVAINPCTHIEKDNIFIYCLLDFSWLLNDCWQTDFGTRFRRDKPPNERVISCTREAPNKEGITGN